MINAFKQIRLNGVLFSGLDGELVLASGGTLARQSTIESSGQLLSSEIDLANVRIDSNYQAILTAMSGISQNSTSINALGDTLVSIEGSLLEVSGDNEFYNQYLSGEAALLREESNLQASGLSAAFDRIEFAEGQINFIKSNLDPAALDSLTEIVTAFQLADGDLSGALTNLTSAANEALAAEIARAVEVENAISGQLQSEIERAVLAEVELANSISLETNRALESEALLTENLGYAVNRISGLEGSLVEAYGAIAFTQSESQENKDAISALSDNVNSLGESLSGKVFDLELQTSIQSTQIEDLVVELGYTGEYLAGKIDTAIGYVSGSLDVFSSHVAAATGDLLSQVVANKGSLDSLAAAHADLSSGTAAGFTSLSSSLVSSVSGIYEKIIFEAQNASDNDAHIVADLISLSGRLDNVISNTDDAALDSLTEIVAAFRMADGSLSGMISALGSNASSSVGQISGALDAEIERATAADNIISGDLAAEIERATSAEATIGGDLLAEVARATSAEATISGDLLAEVARATSAEATISGDLLSEVARATIAEATIIGDLLSEVARATIAEATISGDLLSEVARATSAEAAIGGELAVEIARAIEADATLYDLTQENKAAIEGEVIRASGREDEIISLLNQEINRATGVENILAQDIATETSARVEFDNILLGYITSGLEVAEFDRENLQSGISDIRDLIYEEISGVNLSIDELHDLTNANFLYASGISDRLDSVISNTDPAALDSLTEIVDAFREADGSLSGMISALGSNASSSVGQISGALDAEIERATAADNIISGDLAAEIERATGAEVIISGDLAAEIERATGAEVIISGDLAALDIRVSTIEDSKQAFNVAVPIGNDSLSVSFPGGSFASIPSVVASLEAEVIYQYVIKNKTVSGFDIEFSDTILESNTSIDVIASI